MNENKNPVSTPPKAEQFQLRVAVQVMWTTIVHLGMSSWRRGRELVVVRVGVAVGMLITDLRFKRAGSPGNYCLSDSELGIADNHPPKSPDGDG